MLVTVYFLLAIKLCNVKIIAYLIYKKCVCYCKLYLYNTAGPKERMWRIKKEKNVNLEIVLS